MFPIADDNSEIRTVPYVNYGIIALNVIVFVLLQQLNSNESFDGAFSLVPREVTTGVDLVGLTDVKDATGKILGQINQFANPISVYVTFLSSIFMHSGFMHIFGNMLFLWIFGDNIENRIGHIRYAVFYLLVGFLATLAHVMTDTSSVIPTLGASGAISGVLGGYLLLFPNKQVKAIMFSFMMTTVPAFVAVGLWIGYQVLMGYLSGTHGGGVAYAAHIGGFVAGLALIKFFALGTKPSQLN
jgi:membrane associated rhomboid family serine protease